MRLELNNFFNQFSRSVGFRLQWIEKTHFQSLSVRIIKIPDFDFSKWTWENQTLQLKKSIFPLVKEIVVETKKVTSTFFTHFPSFTARPGLLMVKVRLNKNLFLQKSLSWIGWFTAYLANVFLTKLQTPILPRKSRDRTNPYHASSS